MLDFPGRGHSDPFPELDRPRTWFDYADVVHQVLEYLEIENPPVLMAHSMGGPIALAYHARYGAAGLQLFDGSHLGLLNHRLPPARLGSLESTSDYAGRTFAGNFFDTYRDRHADATMLDLKRGAELLLEASYSQVPGVSHRKSPLGWWDAPAASLATDWHYQGLELADRLGMTCVTGGEHNPYWTVPELTRYGLLAVDEAVARGKGPAMLDPAIVASFGGTIENPAIMRKQFAAEAVTLAGVPRCVEEGMVPPLPERLSDRAEGIDRLARLSPWNFKAPRPRTPARLVDTAWPFGLRAQIPSARLISMASVQGFPGADKPLPAKLFPRIQGPGSEALRAVRVAGAANEPLGASRSYAPGCSRRA
jgi:pimeloyl-ACP methyl ester carboxylesterase